jgi:hypothetical protein
VLNNLFGKGKEPFWQQTYTNLVKFIILLHRVAFDYVILFDVYHCAISPELLQQRIQQAEGLLFDQHFVAISKAAYEGDISVDDVESYLRKRMRQRAVVTTSLGYREGRPLKPATVHQELRVLRRILNENRGRSGRDHLGTRGCRARRRRSGH